MSIRIDPEFEKLIPPLSPEEYAQLEENCVREGIRDPLVVWDSDDGEILVDGHNRMKISAEHGDIPFQIVRMHFDGRDSVKEWIVKNQFGRRNIPIYMRAWLALKLKPIVAEKAKKRQLDAPQMSGEQKKEIKKIWETYPFETARNLVADKEQKYAAERRRERTRSEKQIYFARFGGDKLKVGSSTDPEGRIQTLRVANPDLQLVKTVFFGEGAEKHENSLKKKFHEYQIANECYQCSDDVLNQMIEYTIKESTRKDSTDRQLATIAGVSHDTIHKVEAVENSGNEEIKAAARSGDISVNKAYQQIQAEKKRLEAENAELKKIVVELKDRPPEIREVTREVVPEDYRQTKADLATANRNYERVEREFNAMRKKYEDAREQVNSLSEKLGESTETAKAERDIQYFTTATNDYIRRYGGHVWAFNEMQNVSEQIRIDYVKALRALDAFAQQMISNIEGGIV